MQQQFYSDNETNTSADALKAIGLAEVFHAWLRALGREDTQVFIKDHGSYYEIRLPSALEEEDREQPPRFAAGHGMLLHKTSKGKQSEEQQGSAVSLLKRFQYEEQQERSKAYAEYLKNLPTADRKQLLQNPQAEGFEHLREPPDPDLKLYSCLNHFKIADAYNSLLTQWMGTNDEAFREHLRLILTMFSQHPNAVGDAQSHWDALAKKSQVSGKGSVTLLQVVNPASGKGGNTPKANGLGIGNLDGFWLIEYLKFVGFFTIAAPFLISKSKDRKTYVLHPREIEVTLLRDVMLDFRKSLLSTTAVKLDILAALQFTKTLLTSMEKAARGASTAPAWRRRLHQPTNIIDIAQGFDVAFYKDMGSAYATMNLATINLPGWLESIEPPDYAAPILSVIEEHIQVVKSIRLAKEEEGSEELELLRRYRDFLSGSESHRFFDFAAHYGDYYLAKRRQNQWAVQFTTEGVKHLMKQVQPEQDLSPILAAPGFQAIARAIRHSTITAQSYAIQDAKQHVAGNQRYPYEVRYGLGQELLRTAAYRKEFLGALDVFLQSYTAENGRVEERIAKESLPNNLRNHRPGVRAAHIEDIFQLVDTYGSEIVCKTLVAYGYARDPRTPEGKAQAEASSETLEEPPSGEKDE